ncbi:Respiratory nitrate reductase 2 beta chain [compost metagenome]
MRNQQTGKTSDPALLKLVGMDTQEVEDMYRLLAIAKYNDRFVIPPAHREEVADLFKEQGSCGLDFAGGPGSCGVF